MTIRDAMRYARVHTFQVDQQHLEELGDALDIVAARFAQEPDFRGLVCLERDNQCNEISVITMWHGRRNDETDSEAEWVRQTMSHASGLAVRTERYRVLRFIPGADVGTVPAPALALVC